MLNLTGIIRCRGRIGNAALKFETRFPAILTDHPLASLVIEQAHEGYCTMD